MTDRIRRAAPVAVLLLTACSTPAIAAPATPTVRVEGSSQTIFEGPVTTDGHAVTTQSGGTHPCDGTNDPDDPVFGPTPTGALDDAAKLGGFSWDATWDDTFHDFLVKRVAQDSENLAAMQFWGYFINYESPSKGGCQLLVKNGDEVLFAFDAFSKAHALKLSGPSAAQTGGAVNVRVTDGRDGSPQPAALVNGVATGADGVATLRFAGRGVYRLKAERADSIRSNALVLCVDPPEADPCTSSDKVAPRVQVQVPGRLASERGRSRTMLVSWQADDQTGSGVAHSSAQVREVADGAGPADATGEWRGLVDRAPVNAVHFRGEAGDAYQFRVSVADRAANRTTVETDPVVVPVDDRSRRIWRFSRGWKRVRAQAAWGGTVVRGKEAGATARLRFRGRRVALIGRKLGRGGRVRLTLDGRRKVFRVRGRSPHRTVLWTSRRVRSGTHSLRIRSLGGGTVELDAVAPLP